jgi:preprotein translocase subunit SecD
LKQASWSKWLLIILPVAAAIYLLYPTWQYYQLDQERNGVAGDSVQLDQWDREYGKDFQMARAQRVKLGLDLRGGMYVTLEVDILKLIEESADPQSIDDDFTAILKETRQKTDADPSLDVLESFLQIFRSRNKTLLSYFTLTNQADVTEEAIEEKLRRDSEQAIDQAMEVIKQRINKYDVSEINIQKQGTRRLVLEMPDVKDEKEIRQLLSQTARLEFKRVLMRKEAARTIAMIDQVLKGGDLTALLGDTTKTDTTKADTASAKTDTSKVASVNDTTKKDTGKAKDPYAGLSDDEKARRYRRDYPFSSMIGMYAIANDRLQPFDFVGLPVDQLPDVEYRFVVPERFVPKVLEILQRPDVRRAIPLDLDLILAAKPEGSVAEDQGEKFYDMFGVTRESELTGDVITEAWPSFDDLNNNVVLMEMNDAGAEAWARITGANIGKRIAIVLDGRVYSAPNVQNKIPNGSSQITGMSSAEESKLLAVVLKAGALKAPVKIIEERVVGPSLGEDSINRGLISSAISLAIILLFMLAYYSMGGGIADMALLMNVLLVVAVLAGFKATLTLPGIAGIILSVAMAVDANILVFERIREELYGGRTLKAAIDAGYSKAMSAILDSNITNILAGIVLIFFGVGPVRGFAVTLIIGVMVTLFTSVVLTRAIFGLVTAGGATSFNFGQDKSRMQA